MKNPRKVYFVGIIRTIQPLKEVGGAWSRITPHGCKLVSDWLAASRHCILSVFETRRSLIFLIDSFWLADERWNYISRLQIPQSLIWQQTSAHTCSCWPSYLLLFLQHFHKLFKTLKSTFTTAWENNLNAIYLGATVGCWRVFNDSLHERRLLLTFHLMQPY